MYHGTTAVIRDGEITRGLCMTDDLEVAMGYAIDKAGMRGDTLYIYNIESSYSTNDAGHGALDRAAKEIGLHRSNEYFELADNPEVQQWLSDHGYHSVTYEDLAIGGEDHSTTMIIDPEVFYIESVTTYRKDPRRGWIEVEEMQESKLVEAIRSAVSDTFKVAAVEKALQDYAKEITATGTKFDEQTTLDIGADMALKYMDSVGLDITDEELVRDFAFFFRGAMMGGRGYVKGNVSQHSIARSYYTPLTY